MLKNAWRGYNCTILAYGQTGSGKSYSIMGHGENKGKFSFIVILWSYCNALLFFSPFITKCSCGFSLISKTYYL